MRELQSKQIAGDEIDTVKGNISGASIPKHEEHLVHAEIETKSFDPQTGAKTSKPIKQVFYPADFARMEAAGAFKGKTVTLIHDPSDEKASNIKKITESNKLDINGQQTDEQKKAIADAAKKDEAPAKPLTAAQQKKKDAEDLKNAQVRYKELYNEDPSKEAVLADLLEAIESKEAEIALDQNRDDANTGNTTDDQTQNA